MSNTTIGIPVDKQMPNPLVGLFWFFFKVRAVSAFRSVTKSSVCVCGNKQTIGKGLLFSSHINTDATKNINKEALGYFEVTGSHDEDGTLALTLKNSCRSIFSRCSKFSFALRSNKTQEWRVRGSAESASARFVLIGSVVLVKSDGSGTSGTSTNTSSTHTLGGNDHRPDVINIAVSSSSSLSHSRSSRHLQSRPHHIEASLRMVWCVEPYTTPPHKASHSPLCCHHTSSTGSGIE